MLELNTFGLEQFRSYHFRLLLSVFKSSPNIMGAYGQLWFLIPALAIRILQTGLRPIVY